MIRVTTAFVALGIVGLAGQAFGAEVLRLGLPIACTLGTDCFIQQYTDIDPGPQATDYRCGSATYDGLDGTEFRLKSTVDAARGVRVLASAPGKVKSIRDNMDDKLLVTAADSADVKKRECGNGVVIDHGDGWETQYCHLRRASVLVRPGQTVETGAPIGYVGYSGNTQFAQVHLVVRRNGKLVDPFLGVEPGIACDPHNTALSSSLWAPELRASLTYADATVIEAAFSSAPLTSAQAENGPAATVDALSPALFFYIRLINLRVGDTVAITVDGPAKFRASQTFAPLDRTKAQYITFAGKKRTGERWPAGRYRGTGAVLRGDKIVASPEAVFDMP
jgi:hypothetical protein